MNLKKLIAKSLSIMMCASSAICPFVRAIDCNDNYAKSFEISNEISKSSEVGNNKNNLIFSPFSIKSAFMMAMNGCENETQKEMLKAFNIDDLSKENRAFHEIIKEYNKDGSPVQISNSIWLNTDVAGNLKFSNNYKNLVHSFLFANSREVNKKNAVTTINDWVENQTKGKIKNLISSPDFSSALVNTIHFKSDWECEFRKEKTYAQKFHNQDGTTVNTDFMHQTSHFNYFEDENLQLLEMRYKNSEISMYVTLPKDGKCVTSEMIENAIKNKNSEKVELSLPKFKTEISLNLNKIMKNLGINKAFDESCQDFNMPMFGQRNLDLTAHISDVIHKAVIEVDEKGTEAAAATAIIVKTYGCIPKFEIIRNFNANRPFSYQIIDNSNRQVLFMGEQKSFK